MATHVREDQASLLNDRIDVLEKNAVEGSPLKQVLTTVGAILALIRVSSLILCPITTPRIALTAWTGQDDC